MRQRLQANDQPCHRPTLRGGLKRAGRQAAKAAVQPVRSALGRGLAGAVLFHVALALALGKLVLPAPAPTPPPTTLVVPIQFLGMSDAALDFGADEAAGEDPVAAAAEAKPVSSAPRLPVLPPVSLPEPELPLPLPGPQGVIAVELARPTGPSDAWLLPASEFQTVAGSETNAVAAVEVATASAGEGAGRVAGTSTGGGSAAGWRVPAYWRNPRPVYPVMARQNRWEGTTLLRVEVLSNGVTGTVEVRESSGHDLLDEAAVQAVRRWRFVAARENDVAVKAWVEVPIVFELEEAIGPRRTASVN